MDAESGKRKRAWSSSTLSYLLWRYGPGVVMFLFLGMALLGRHPEPKGLSATLGRMALPLVLLAVWTLVALAWVAFVAVAEGEEHIVVIKGRSAQHYPWHMVRSLRGSVQLRTTRFWWLRIDSELPVLFITDHPTFGIEHEDPPLVQEIRRRMEEHRR